MLWSDFCALGQIPSRLLEWPLQIIIECDLFIAPDLCQDKVCSQMFRSPWTQTGGLFFFLFFSFSSLSFALLIYLLLFAHFLIPILFATTSILWWPKGKKNLITSQQKAFCSLNQEVVSLIDVTTIMELSVCHHYQIKTASFPRCLYQSVQIIVLKPLSSWFVLSTSLCGVPIIGKTLF